MKVSLCLFALLALLGTAFATLGDNGMTTYTGRKREPNTLVFGNQLVVDQGIQATLDLTKEMLKGTWKPTPNDPATPKQEIHLECLNSVAPPPLNWKMWCPGTDAKIVGWTDKSGAAHRQITLRPQKGMTSTMYQWFITTHVLGLMPPVVEFQGNHYYYYHLWHPLDHVEAAWALGPTNPLMQKGPPLYTLIHERYRNPANFPYDRHYETNGWFYVHDSFVNIMKNRYVITMPLMGLPTWTMILEFNDTPEGLVVDVEVIAGIPFKGYDERAPHEGFTAAAGMNELFTAPLVSKQRNSYDWLESINAISRHVIEEFSNLQHFVPTLYERCNVLGMHGINWIPSLGTWLQYNKKSINDGSSVSFYHGLVALAKRQINLGNTTHGHVIDASMAKLNKTVMHATDAATALNIMAGHKTYVPASNAATKLSYELNKANGAHPERDVTIPAIKRAVVHSALEATHLNGTGINVGDAVSNSIHHALNATGVTANVVTSRSGNMDIAGHLITGLSKLLRVNASTTAYSKSATNEAPRNLLISIGGKRKNGSLPFLPSVHLVGGH